jgi:hypothetical protein
MSTKQAAVEPPSDVNLPDVRTSGLGADNAETPGRGPRPDGTAEVPDRQLRIREV